MKLTNQWQIVAHVAKGESWQYVSVIKRRYSQTWTYSHYARGVIHVRVNSDKQVVGVSWINEHVDSPTTLAAGDWFQCALDVLMGTRNA